MDVTAAEWGGGYEGEAPACSASAVLPQVMLLHSSLIQFFGGKRRKDWCGKRGREHGAQCLASMEIPGRHVLLEEAAISAVLNTLHGSGGDVPKPLHDLAPNKHAVDGK